MSKMMTLEDLFEHQIQDLYSAETQLLEALPMMVEAANDPQLKAAFEKHLTETEMQVERLEQIADLCDIDVEGETCLAMEGLIAEGESMIDEDATPAVKDAGLIAEAQRIEHYEISGYGTAARFAEELGHEEAFNLLQMTLAEEQAADTKLNDLAKNTINRRAVAG